MHYFQKIVVFFYCFEETCIINILLDVPSREKTKAFFPITAIMPFKCEYNSNIDNIEFKFSHFDSPNEHCFNGYD